MQYVAASAVIVFENVEFDVVDIHNVPWLRAPQIERALGYEKRDAIGQIYARNSDEFTDEMTQLVERDTPAAASRSASSAPAPATRSGCTPAANAPRRSACSRRSKADSRRNTRDSTCPSSLLRARLRPWR